MSLQKVYVARDIGEAEWVRQMLEDAGVPATVMGQSLAAARGGLPMTADTLPSVWVHDDQADGANGIIAGMREAQTSEASEEMRRHKWLCPACGRKIEGQFTQCWKCGADRPENAQIIEDATDEDEDDEAAEREVSALTRLVAHVLNQEEQEGTTAFRDDLIALLKKHGANPS